MFLHSLRTEALLKPHIDESIALYFPSECVPPVFSFCMESLVSCVFVAYASKPNTQEANVNDTMECLNKPSTLHASRKLVPLNDVCQNNGHNFFHAFLELRSTLQRCFYSYRHYLVRLLVPEILTFCRRISPTYLAYSFRRNLPSDNPYDRNKPYKYYLLSERSFMYALYGHQFSRVFGRYGMAILALVLYRSQALFAQQTAKCRTGKLSKRARVHQMYFAEMTKFILLEPITGHPVESVLSPADALAEPIAEGKIESSSVQDSPTESFYDAIVFGFSGGTCDSSGCDNTTACGICGQHACGGCRSWELFQNCTPPGMLQWMKARHDHGNACWTGRTDAVMLWRSAPYSRELVITGPRASWSSQLLNADQLESGMAAGPRIQLFREDACGSAIEFGYLGAWSFQSEKLLSWTPATRQHIAADLIGSGNKRFSRLADVNLTSQYSNNGTQ